MNDLVSVCLNGIMMDYVYIYHYTQMDLYSPNMGYSDIIGVT